MIPWFHGTGRHGEDTLLYQRISRRKQDPGHAHLDPDGFLGNRPLFSRRTTRQMLGEVDVEWERSLDLHALLGGGTMKIGTIVRNLSHNSRAKLFSCPLVQPSSLGPHRTRYEVGLLNGVGIILDASGSDFRILSGGVAGWCYAGNLLEVE